MYTKTKNTFLKRLLIVFAVITITLSICVVAGCGVNQNAKNSKTGIGVAWCKDDAYDHMLLSFEKAGGKAEVLDQVKVNDIAYDGENISKECLDNNGMLKTQYAEEIKSKPYDKTNVKDVVKDRKLIVFCGGEDVCPSLYKNPQPWYDNNVTPEFFPARDVSDYILMSYCLDNNIPVFAVCRGMQLYSVAAGADMIQDLPTYFATNNIPYNDEHRKSGEINGKNVRGNHPVTVTDQNSILYSIFKTNMLDKPYSSHHQAVKKIDSTKTKVVATANINGLETIEALERADTKAFGLFVQFHPEHSLAHHVNNEADKDSFLSYDDSLKIFKYLVDNLDNLNNLSK